MDLDTVPDVIGLTGRRPAATVIRVLQGRDVQSVRALVPDPRVLERGIHDVNIVDMGDLPHMVWLQQDLDTMRAEAKKRFRNTRPENCSYCNKWIKCDMYRHVARHRIAWIMSGGRMMYHGTLNLPVWRSLFPRGRFSAKFGRIRSRPIIPGYRLTCSCLAISTFRWLIIIGCTSVGFRILLSERIT